MFELGLWATTRPTEPREDAAQSQKWKAGSHALQMLAHTYGIDNENQKNKVVVWCVSTPC